MRVDHGGAELLVAQQLLDVHDVHARIQQRRPGAGMAEAMRIERLDLQVLTDGGQVTVQPVVGQRLAAGQAPQRYRGRRPAPCK